MNNNVKRAWLVLLMFFAVAAAAQQAPKASRSTFMKLMDVQEMWEDGKPRREGFLRDGDPQGLWLAWHRSGALRMVGSFETGKAEGRWNAYDGEGETVASGPVLNGRLSGEWTVWADGEQVRLGPVVGRDQ